MEIAGFIFQLVECMSPSVARRWNNHRSVYKNMDRLRKSYEELNCRKRDIESRLVTDHIEGETELKSEVKNWLESVEKIGPEVEGIEAKVRIVKFFSRAGLGKIVNLKIAEVVEIHQKGVFSDGLVIQLPQRGDVMPTTSILGGETTFQRKMEEIWTCLLGKEFGKIGVYGMGGIGKTTALQLTNNRLLEDHKDDFRAVILVTVSKDCSIIHLQDKIANKLDLNLSKDDDQGTRAARLYRMLNKKKRFALILDDVWEVYNLHEVGIPEPTSENGCKIVVTTRSIEVCRGMSCNPIIKMECLSDNEALKLFKDLVGSDALKVSNLEAKIVDVARECAGLPLAIAVVAGSLRGVVDINEWEIALEDLREYSNVRSPYNRIFEQLKFSFDRLKDKQLQDCLLYCSLYPEDFEIKRGELIEHLIAEGIIEERPTRQSQISRGNTMLNKLVNSCLLNNIIDEEECVIMHDLVRDMALIITSTGSPRYLVRSGVGLPDEGNWDNDVVKVSLMDNENLSSIPSEIEPRKCLRLSSLLLPNNYNLKEISNNFFLHMTSLSVLDLSVTGIDHLPPSISDLTALTALFLRYCLQLVNLPSLAKLTNLRLLDLFGSSIEQVPHGLEMLTNLRYLNLSDTKLESMPSEILCNLVNLQCLLLIGNFKSLKVRFEDLEKLRKLETIGAALYDIKNWNEFVSYWDSRKLASYILQLGSDEPMSSAFYESDKVVCLSNFSIGDNATSSECPLLLPEDVEILTIKNCNLEELNLQSCKMLMEIGSEEEGVCSSDGNEDKGKGQAVKMITLPKLKSLYLEQLPNLLSLPLIANSVEQIEILGCGKLRKLPIIDRDPFPSSLKDAVIDRETWSVLEWEHPDAKNSVESVLRLLVSY